MDDMQSYSMDSAMIPRLGKVLADLCVEFDSGSSGFLAQLWAPRVLEKGDSVLSTQVRVLRPVIARVQENDRWGWLGHQVQDGTPPRRSHGCLVQGLPYTIHGVGDLLALFRCASCKFNFRFRPEHPSSMGTGEAPDR